MKDLYYGCRAIDQLAIPITIYLDLHRSVLKHAAIGEMAVDLAEGCLARSIPVLFLNGRLRRRRKGVESWKGILMSEKMKLGENVRWRG